MASVLAVAGLLLAAAPSAQAAKNVNFFWGNPTSSTGGEAGLFNTPGGVAVNSSTSNVYVVDRTNHRIQEFDKNGNFIRAWGKDVVESGPDQANETQTVVVAATSGNFTLTFGAATTASLPATATAAEVQGALNGLSTISAGGGSVSVSGGPGNATGSVPYVITFNGGPLAHTDVAQVTATNVSLAGGSPSSSVSTGTSNPGATGFEICTKANGDFCKSGLSSAPQSNGAMSTPQGIAVDQATGNVYVTDQGNARVDEYSETGAFIRSFGQDVVELGPDNSTATSAVQTLNVTATGGKYTLSFGGKTTGELAFNANAATIQTALTGLSSIGSGNATVSETSPGLFKVTFAGALANNPEPLIAAASAASPNELTGGIVGIVNTTTGATGFEVCVAASGDVCKAGLNSASTGGAFKTAFNGYPAVAPVGAPNAGDVLVADPANLRVQEFTSAGAFVRTFGLNVVTAGPDNNGTTNFEVCSAVAGDACGIGSTGAGAGTFSSSVNRVAEDASGNVYTVESATNFRVQKFTLPGNVVTPQGNFDEADLKGTAATNAPLDVAIEPSTGNVLVTKAFAAGTGTPPATVAERRILEVSPGGTLQATHMANDRIEVVNGIAYSPSTGRIYVSSTTTTNRVYVLDNLLTPSATISAVTSPGSTTATFNGTVNPNTYPTNYRFEYSSNGGVTWTNFPVVEASLPFTDNASHSVSQAATGLQPNTTYLVRLTAVNAAVSTLSGTTSTVAFSTSTAAPTIAETRAETVEETTAKLTASINPNSSPTTYHFEWGASTSYGNRVPLEFDPVAGSTGQAVKVSANLTGLSPDTTYHFRVVATNASGTTNGPDQELTTLNGHELPDSRVPELVSPADKRPVGSVTQIAYNQLYFEAAESGEEMAYLILNGSGESPAGGEVIYSARRGESSWSSKEITPPPLIPSPLSVNGHFAARSGAVRYIDPQDQKCALVETHNPLTSDTPAADPELGVYNLYRWNAADGSYTLITNRIPLNPTASNAGNFFFEVAGASADCSRIFFRSPSYSYFANGNGIYEWENGMLRNAAVLPDGSIPTGNQAPKTGEARNDVSPNGRLFFVATSDQGADAGKASVFVRKGSGARETVDAAQPTNGPTQGAGYETASPDGSHVFFLANYGIASTTSLGPTGENCTNISGAGTTACDLYDYNVETGQLKDISADPNSADPRGAVVQGVMTVTPDGSTVYFAARGQLVPGSGNTYAQNIAQFEGYAANVYRYQGGVLTYVGRLTNGDLGSGSASHTLIHTPVSWSSQTNNSGSYLLFVSNAQIPVVNPNGVQEAYLYSAATGTVECVSCRRDGKLPRSRVSAAATVIPNQITSFGKYTPRSLTNDGRVIFNSEDALTPNAIEGEGKKYGGILSETPIQNNIYEWNHGQVSLLATGYVQQLDLGGPNGRDVFIKSYSQLDPNDFDFSADVYDLRSGGGLPAPPVAPTPCDPAADQCQGTPTPPPSAPSPVTSEVSGPGNPAAAAHKKAANKNRSKHHRKHRKRHQHRAANADRGGSK